MGTKTMTTSTMMRIKFTTNGGRELDLAIRSTSNLISLVVRTIFLAYWNRSHC